MANFKLLDPEYIYNSYMFSLDKGVGLEAKATSFSYYLGVRSRNNDQNVYWWNATGKTSYDKDIFPSDFSSYEIGIRPAVKYSEIKNDCVSKGYVGYRGMYEVVEYGEFPQTRVEYSGTDQEIYEDLNSGLARKTGKKFTINGTPFSDKFTPVEIEEYDLYGRKYALIPIDLETGSKTWNRDKDLYDPQSAPLGQWFKVEPVKWIVDQENDIAMSRDVLAAGMKFDYSHKSKKETDASKIYEASSMNTYLNTFFAKDIMPSPKLQPIDKHMRDAWVKGTISSKANTRRTTRTITNTNNIPNTSVDKPKSSSSMKDMKDIIIDTSMNKYKDHYNEFKEEENMLENEKNPYGFDYGDVSEEDIIKGMVESNIPVFLHGKPGEGKSARVKQYDPDCEIIYLGNATPESLCGKSALDPNNSEMKDIPPSWYENVVKKAKEEPDKIHIVFFDELTNARPTIQGMAMNIILDKEINGKYRLPDNVRIVAAGNELEDSLAANEIAEPVFDRFAHVYIETNAESLLAYGTSPGNSKGEKLGYQKKKDRPTKFHPAVNAYIAYRGEDAVRTAYNGEEPNVDPRKWEFASELLYEVGKPEMLRAILGEQITQDFISFVHSQVITLDDVLSGNYSDADLEMNAAQKYATCVGLLSVDEKNVKTVLAFVGKLGEEIAATFKTNWAHGDPKRAEILQAAEKKGLFSRLKG